jgi:hypothetical protein
MRFRPQPRERGLVIILGAGASYGADVPSPPPVMKSFIQDGRRTVKSDYSGLWELLERMGYPMETLDAGHPNLEELFTVLHAISTGIWYRSRTDYVDLVGGQFAKIRPVDLLVSFIVEVLDSPSISALSRPCRHHSRVFETLRHGDTVISFNYDLIAEASLRKTVRWSEAGGYGFACQNYISKMESSGVFDPELPCDVALLKPHGSLNWGVKYDTSLLRGQDTLPMSWDRPVREELLGLRRWPGHGREEMQIAVRDLDEIGDHCYKTLAIDAFKFYNTIPEEMTTSERQLFMSGPVSIYRDIYMVPPAAYKFSDPTIPDQVTEIWSHAMTALVQAKRVLCIGYSFPSTDVEFGTLFRLALLRNSNSRISIEVVNPDLQITQTIAAMTPRCRIKHVGRYLSEYMP